MRAINATEKIGQKADLSNGYYLFRLLSNFWDTQLIDTGNEIQFEFDRSKKFIEKVIEAPVNVNFPFISLKNKETDLQPYIVIFPGAGEVQKQWAIENFITCAKHIINNTKHKIIICGSGNDFPLGEIIIAKCHNDQITNLCGKTSLTELINYIHNAELLITNDSSAIHIAACTHTVSICIGNGRHYGRFTPYPKEMAPFLHFVFSKNVVKMAESDVENLKKQTLYHSIESINEIDANNINNICNNLLKI
jgi:ADP-heptose:LPS heptosyltransferase